MGLKRRLITHGGGPKFISRKVAIPFVCPYLLRSAVGMTHDLRSDLWWTIPFRILLGQFWDTLRIPHDQASPSQTHRCPGVCGSRQSDHVIIFHIQPTGIHGLCFGSCFSWSTFKGPFRGVPNRYTENKSQRLCLIKVDQGWSCLLNHLVKASVRRFFLRKKMINHETSWSAMKRYDEPLSQRIVFSVDYTQKLTTPILALKLSVSAIITPRWTATISICISFLLDSSTWAWAERGKNFRGMLFCGTNF